VSRKPVPPLGFVPLQGAPLNRDACVGAPWCRSEEPLHVARSPAAPPKKYRLRPLHRLAGVSEETSAELYCPGRPPVSFRTDISRLATRPPKKSSDEDVLRLPPSEERDVRRTQVVSGGPAKTCPLLRWRFSNTRTAIVQSTNSIPRDRDGCRQTRFAVSARARRMPNLRANGRSCSAVRSASATSR